MEPGDNIAEDVRALLSTDVRTYEQLEALVFLFGKPRERWTAPAMAEQLKIGGQLTRSALEHLVGRGFLEAHANGGDPEYQYSPRDSRLHATVDRLVTSYEKERLGIVRLMNANALDRLRTAAIRTFADAFLVTKDEDGDG